MTRTKVEYCTSYTCLVRTCGRHRCHHSGEYNSYTEWIDYGPKNCEYYKGRESLEHLDYVPPIPLDFEEEDEM